APRWPLFLGRSLPVIANGIVVAAFAFVVGGLLLGIHVPLGAVGSLALVIAVTAFACTGLGLVNAAVGLRFRDTAVSSNLFFRFLLVFCGVNVPVHDLPGWMSTIAQGEPLIFATLSYYLFKAGRTPGTLLYASLSAGLMGIWTSTLFGSGGVITWQRWQGTLEPTVASPPPLMLVLFPLTFATASIGLYS